METDITLLCNYANGLLPKKRMDEIHDEIQKNPELRFQYEGILEIMRLYPDRDPEEVADEIGQRIVNKIENKIQQDNSHTENNKKGKVRSLWPFLAAAASIVIIIGIYFSLNKPSAEQMAMNCLKETPILETGRDSSSENLEWKEYWEQKNYQRIVNIISIEDTPNHTDFFVLGVSYMKLNPPNFIEAKKSFESTISKGMVYRSKSFLYLGIIEIIQHHPELAIEHLKNSSEPQAQLILKRLQEK
jgi:hypothetical protein